MSTKYSNAVVVRGSVALPGRYPWREGMTIRDLIPSKEALLSESYWESLAVAGQSDNASTKRNLVHLADINWHYAVIERLMPNDLQAQLITFDLEKALSGDAAENKPLEPNDVVTVYTQAEMPVPTMRRTRFVKVLGEVNAAGTYSVGPGETLRSILQRAGGVTPQAYLYGSEFTRVDAQRFQQHELDRLIAQMETRPLRQVSSAGNANAENERQMQAEERQRTVQRLRLLRPNGRLVLNLKPTDEDVSGVPDIPLEDGDALTVPARPAFVSVVGSTNQNGSFIYSEGLRAGDFIHQAGGYNADADKSHSFIIRANGSVIANGSGMFSGGLESIKMLPGDTIVITSKERGRLFIDNLKDWSQILGNIGLAAAAINVFK